MRGRELSALAVRAKTDKAELEKLMTETHKLLIRFFYKFDWRRPIIGYEAEDFAAIGCKKVWQALHAFDPKISQFSSFAMMVSRRAAASALVEKANYAKSKGDAGIHRSLKVLKALRLDSSEKFIDTDGNSFHHVIGDDKQLQPLDIAIENEYQKVAVKEMPQRLLKVNKKCDMSIPERLAAYYVIGCELTYEDTAEFFRNYAEEHVTKLPKNAIKCMKNANSRTVDNALSRWKRKIRKYTGGFCDA